MNKLVVTMITTVVVAITATATSVINTIKTKKLIKKLNKSIGDVEQKTEEEITETVIKKAVNVAADKKVDAYMRDTQDETLRIASRNLDIQAKNAVESYAKDIRKQASEKITQQVSNLDVDALKRQVCNQAEKHVLERLDDCLDESVKSFKKQLDNTQKTYNSFVKTLEEEKKKESDRLRFVVF